MRRSYLIVLIVIGIVLIGILFGTGVYFLTGDNNTTTLDNKTNNNEIGTKNENIEDVITFNRINSFNLEEVCSNSNLISTYINTSNYYRIDISYPDCVHEYTLSKWYKYLYDDYPSGDIEIHISHTYYDTISEYMNYFYTYAISLKNDEYYQDVTYTDISEYTYNGYNIAIFEVNYASGIFSNRYYDSWYIAIELYEDYILTIEIKVNDAVMSYETILGMIESLSLEEDGAVFAITTKEGDYQVGTIYQNLYKSYDHGYKVNFKVGSKYSEEESTSSNYDSIVFRYEDFSSKVYVNMSIDVDNYKTIDEKINSYYKNSELNEESYTNIVDEGIKNITLSDKNVYYFVKAGNLISSDGSIGSNYATSYVFYEISDGYYLNFYISTRNVTIDEDLISEFLNFEVEGY